MEERSAFKLLNHPHFFIFNLSLLISLLFLFPGNVESQRNADIGVFAGTSWYQGDINPYLPFYSPGFAAGLLYRYNFHPRTSVRLSGIFHSLSGNDLDFSDELQQARAASFNSSYIDMTAVWEFNFLPYKTAFRKTKYSPYVSAGLGYNLVFSSDIPTANNHIVMPLGLGFKFNISERMSAGLEYSFRKTLTDNIDGIENYAIEERNMLLGNKDWYTFAGIFITYKIFKYREDCPAYD